MRCISCILKFVFFVSIIALAGCNSSAENVSIGNKTSSGGLSYKVGQNPSIDPQNTYPYFIEQSEPCTSDIGEAKQCINDQVNTVTQLKYGPGFIGSQYGLPSDPILDIELDPLVTETIETYSGATATYSAKHYPVAVEHGKFTYFVYSGPVLLDNSQQVATTTNGGGSTSTTEFKRKSDNKSNALGIYIARLNHNSGRVSAPLLIHVKHTDDPHDNAVLNFDQDGNLYILVSGRALLRSAILYFIERPNMTAIFNSQYLEIKNISPDNLHYQSLNHWSISTPDYAGITYPKLIRTNFGFRLIYTLYCQKNEDESCLDNSRQLWSAKLIYNLNDSKARLEQAEPLAAVGGHYAIASSSDDGTDIIVAFNVLMKGEPENRTNVYVLYSDDSGESWSYFNTQRHRLFSADSLLPINIFSELNAVAAVNFHHYGQPVDQRVYLKDVSFSGSGSSIKPTILFVGSTASNSHTPTLENIHYLGEVTLENRRWQNKVITSQVDHNYSTGFLYQYGDEMRSYFPATDNVNNNAMAGGTAAYTDVLANSGHVTYLNRYKKVGESEYLTGLCEINYMRSVVGNQYKDFIGIASAANPYQFEADSANSQFPAAPIFILDSEGRLFRLPMQISEQDSNEEMPLTPVDANNYLQCDSSSQ